jgi:monoamine oxidase
MDGADGARPGSLLTRRRFFEQLAATGGLSLALAGMDALGFGFSSAQAAPPVLDGGAKGATVVILGAGVAGLTAAYELGRAGYEVRLLEARTFAGGRAQTARRGFEDVDLNGNRQVCDFDEGQYINIGPWRIPFWHRSTLHYVKRFAVPVELFNNDNDAAWVYSEKGSGPLAGKPVRKMRIAADARGYTAELMAKLAAKGDLDAALSPVDRKLFIDYLVGEGRLSSADLKYLGTEGRGYDVWPGAGVDPGPGREAAPYAFADVMGSQLWRVLSSVSQIDQQRTMFEPVGGMAEIPKAFVRNIPEGVIRYGAKVTRIRQSASGVKVAFAGPDGKPGEVAGDYLICTIPLSVLKNIPMDASAPFLAAMQDVSYAPVNKIGLQMKRRFWEDDDWIYGGHVYNDIPGIGTISLPSTGWLGEKGVVLGYYAFAAEAVKVSLLTPPERARFAVAAGQKIFPQYAESFETAFSKSWHLDPFNLGGWAEWSDEARRRAYPVLCEPDGRIYLSGEHLSYLGGWQAGGIESAWQQIAKLHARVQKA